MLVELAVSIAPGVAAHIMNESMSNGSYGLITSCSETSLYVIYCGPCCRLPVVQDVVAKLFRLDVWINYLVEKFQATVSSLRRIKPSLALLIWNILSWKGMRLNILIKY